MEVDGMNDCCGQEIIPKDKKLSVHTNRHPNCNGTSWGWIEGCTLNICWSDDHCFDYAAALEFVKEYNDP